MKVRNAHSHHHTTHTHAHTHRKLYTKRSDASYCELKQQIHGSQQLLRLAHTMLKPVSFTASIVVTRNFFSLISTVGTSAFCARWRGECMYLKRCEGVHTCTRAWGFLVVDKNHEHHVSKNALHSSTEHVLKCSDNERVSLW